MSADYSKLPRFSLPIQYRAELLDLDMEPWELELNKAWHAAMDRGFFHEGDQIEYLHSLILSEDFELILHKPQHAKLRDSVVDFLKWINESLELTFFPIGSSLDSDAMAYRIALQKRLRQAIRAVTTILLRIGVGAVSENFRCQLKKSLRFFARHVYRAAMRVCSRLSKLGLRVDQFNHHYFIKYLLPDPRGDFSHATT